MLAELANSPDPEPFDATGERRAIVGNPSPARQGIAWIVAGDGAEDQGAILRRPRDRARSVHRPADGNATRARHEAPRWPQPDRATPRGRRAYRASCVLTERGRS